MTTSQQRTLTLFKLLVERYIREGVPVGSKVLAQDFGHQLSAAAIRHVMADLEAQGLIISPHTSAGRVPTEKGFRTFVDTLLTVKPLALQDQHQLHAEFEPSQDVTDMVDSTSQMLSRLTRLVGIVSTPQYTQVALRQLELLPLSGRRVLVVLVLNEQDVYNRIIETDRDYTAAELKQAAHSLNSQFAGQDLQSVRQALLVALRADKTAMDQLMAAAIEVGSKAFTSASQDRTRANYVLSGAWSLLDDPGQDVSQLQQLLQVFEQKRDMLYLINQCIQADDVQIFIGSESGHDALQQCSIIMSPYRAEGRAIGVLGVIGPTRMAYDRAIATVELTAKILSSALNQPE